MPVLPVTVPIPGADPVRGLLSTEHSASSYGDPVLVLDDPGPSYEEGAVVAHGPADVTRHGVAATLHVEPAVEPTLQQTAMLDRWREACRAYAERHGLPTLAETYVDAGGWTSGDTWGSRDLHLADALDTLVDVERARAHHDVGDGEPAPVVAWRFPDGSGVVAWGTETHGGHVGGNRYLSATWALCDREGRTPVGRVLWQGEKAEDAPAATSGSVEAEVVGKILLRDNRLVIVKREPDPDNGPKITVRLSPSQSQRPEGFDLSVSSALALVRALDAALRLPALEDPEDAGRVGTREGP